MANNTQPIYIDTAEDLLSAAGRGQKLRPAILRLTNQPVLIEYTDREKHWDNYSSTLEQAAACAHKVDKWMKMPSGELCEPDDSCKVPKIVVSRAFEFNKAGCDRHHSELFYVFIVQGANGPNKAKVMMATEVKRAAAVMIHQAMNGYSTVFSAAIEKGIAATLFSSRAQRPWNLLQFRRVEFWIGAIEKKTEDKASLENRDPQEGLRIIHICF